MIYKIRCETAEIENRLKAASFLLQPYGTEMKRISLFSMGSTMDTKLSKMLRYVTIRLKKGQKLTRLQSVKNYVDQYKDEAVT